MCPVYLRSDSQKKQESTVVNGRKDMSELHTVYFKLL